MKYNYNMPKGTQTKIIFDESDFFNQMPCGYYIQGRPKTQQLKSKFHAKNCDVCKNIPAQILAKMGVKEFFTSEAPPSSVSGSHTTQKSQRAVDRKHTTKGFYRNGKVVGEFEIKTDVDSEKIKTQKALKKKLKRARQKANKVK